VVRLIAEIIDHNEAVVRARVESRVGVEKVGFLVGPVPRVIEIGQDTEVAQVKGEDFLMFGFTIGVVTLVLAVNRVTLAIESIYAYVVVRSTGPSVVRRSRRIR